MTASVNAYGDLMQFARYLGAGRSGMFSVDHYETSEPCYVRDRAEDLQNLCTERNKRSYGLVLGWRRRNRRACGLCMTGG
ncbi:hypothetical protein B0H67DRAFT_567821 [Lasiosphaeris hirsuta]|uniref:Uncharacterized protein n=1 Tax=Lasiosphaeris hirsuta TaxID=260670 RepID=A0AA40AYM0_9PEZI|nr:hypothetical protein B0H67DRAFT_567821 [Lasiosphaeris hirsuta]